MQCVRQLERRLTAELNDDAVQRAVVLFHAHDFHDVLECQRLKVQPVRGVIVGRNRLWVAVDHDGFIALIGQGIAGVAAAIIKLDALTDPVRTAAQNHDLFAIRGTRLAFHIAHNGGLIGGIHVRRLRFELGTAGVDPLEHSDNALLDPRAAHIGFGHARQGRQAGIGKAHHL